MKSIKKSTKMIFFVFIFLEIDIFSQNFKINKFAVEGNYYDVPLEIRLGFLSRQNDFQNFVFAGTSFSPLADEGSLNFFVGNRINFKHFSQTLSGNYSVQLWQNFSEQNEIFAKNNFDFAFSKGFCSLETKFGFLRKLKMGEKAKRLEKCVENVVTLGTFLYDGAIFQATSEISLKIANIYKSDFSSYEIAVKMPFLWDFNIFEIASRLDFSCEKEISKTGDFQLGKTETQIFSRAIFSDDNDYFSHFCAFEVEGRYYFLRHNGFSQDFFFSTFLATCIAFDDFSTKFLCQAGFGFGYSLFSVVPFTLQFGFRKDFSPILSLSIVCRTARRQ